MFAYADIILLAIIAGAVLWRLRGELGKRDGHQGPPRGLGDRGAQDNVRPMRPLHEQADAGDDEPGSRVLHMPDAHARAAEDGIVLSDVDDTPVGQGIAAIRQRDGTFTRKYFVEGAKAAFEMILEAFGRHDVDTLKPLLSPAVLASFTDDIHAQKARNVRREITLVAINSAEIQEAEVRGNTARIAVKFESEQVIVERAEDGSIAGGDSKLIQTVADVWTFERDLRASDPNWTLVET